MRSKCFGTNLLGAPSEAFHVVQPGQVVSQTFVAYAVDLALGPDEGVELGDEEITVQRLTAKLPGTRLICGQPLRAAHGTSRRHHNRRGRAERRLLPKHSADIDAIEVGKPRIDNHRVRLRRPCKLEGLAAGVRS